MKINNTLKFFIAVFVCQLAGIIGSVFTSPAIGKWYAFIKKPSFSPPNWVFAPVWTLLFLLMAVSLYLIWKKEKTKERKTALWIFSYQLLLNILWSILFFGLQSPLAGFIEIIILWLAILATIITFFPLSKPAGLLFLPYLGWVSFAALLNFFLWRLNF